MERPISSYHWKIDFPIDVGMMLYYWRARYDKSIELRSQDLFNTIDDAQKDWESFAKSQCFTWSMEP